MTALPNATASDFVHLHLHSQYSLLDGAIRIDELLPTIAKRGMHSVAVTDHGNMYGAVHFYKAAKKYGIKPILGCEAYVAGRGRHDKTARDSAHLVLLAKNNEGYKNLSYLVSMGFMEGFYYNPRIDKELLKKHSRGLIGLSACLGGVVNKTFLRHGEASAAKVAKEYAELFEPGDFYLELQSNGYEAQERANAALMEIGRHYNIPMVATADSHYLSPEDAAAHEILMCIGHSQSLHDFRLKMHHSNQLFVRTPQQMFDALGRLCPEAIENSVRIANRCEVELDLSGTYLPNYSVPAHQTRESYLEERAVAGLKRRMAESYYAMHAPTYRARLDYELGVITKMGFAGYFLIVWDFIRFAKDINIPVGPGRGSGAGSLVAFCLRITDLDPIPHDLLFERFLNPERVSMPDFDIDFCQDRRGEVIDYVANKYGKQNVGQIVTYSQLSAKSVIKDVGRVLDLPFAEVNALTKLIPNLVNGRKVSIDQALDIEPKLRAVQRDNPTFGRVIAVARALEGLNRQTGIHAAGIVIGDKPLWNFVPVCRGKEGELVTQFAKDEVEQAGLVKFDFLGLKTLTVVAGAQALVRRRDGDGPLGPNASFDAARLPLDDKKVYALIASGDTDGVFQLESTGFKELLKRLRPDRFEDVVAAVALYRPGPLDAGMVDDYIARKHRRKKVSYPHPVCKSILDTTYGVIVYQEQVMRIAVALCGFTMGEADILRKAMGKKKADVMAQMRQKFVAGAQKTSHMAEGPAADLFCQIEKFAGYAFNKSHSAAYAVISYQTAYLKTYYPVEFMAALLSTEMRTQDNIVRYINSARDCAIAIALPCVNKSGRDFTVQVDVTAQPHGQKILFGLGAVKGIGDGAIATIVEGRRERPYSSLTDFCERIDPKRVNRKALEALIKSGACDSFSRSRSQNFCAIDAAIDAGQRAYNDRAIGQTNLFAALGAEQGTTTTPSPASSQGQGQGYGQHRTMPLPRNASSYVLNSGDAWSERQRLAFEKDALGFYITGHPLDHYRADLPRLGTATTQTLGAQVSKHARFGAEVSVCGVIGAIRERPLKNGNGRMAFLTLEDLQGSCEVLVFSKTFAECEHILKSADPIVVRGHTMVDGDEEGQGVVKIRATAIESLSDARAHKTRAIHLRITTDGAHEHALRQLKDAMCRHRGDVPLQVSIRNQGQFEADIATSNTLRVCPSDAFIARLQELFGAESVVLGLGGSSLA